MSVFLARHHLECHIVLHLTLWDDIAAIHREDESGHFSSRFDILVGDAVLCLLVDFPDGCVKDAPLEILDGRIRTFLYIQTEAELVECHLSDYLLVSHHAAVLQHQFQQAHRIRR